MLADFVASAQWFFLFYFLGLHGSYLLLNIASIIYVSRYMKEKTLLDIPGMASDIMPPVSLIVPAYNEEATILQSISALMQLQYPEFEVIIVNDGSSDDTMGILKRELRLSEFPEAYRKRLPVEGIHKFFLSNKYQGLRVIDKANGGKPDAANAGINAARYPLVCIVDADSILQRDSLQRVVQPFLFDNRTIASGGTVRIVNGSKVKQGFIEQPALPRTMLPLIQVVEYLRAFLFGRLGWSTINSLLIVSGAFGVFHKETLIAAGGYDRNMLGEDMELIIRLHRYMREQKKDYRISFVPDPICWTEAPEDIRSLANQRIRWQRGLCESLFQHISLCFNPRAGSVGMLAFPFMLLFEWAGPVVELLGFLVIVLGFITGQVDLIVLLLLIGVATLFGVVLSVTALLMEELSFHLYQKPTDLLRLFMAALVENFGYRQLTTLFRVTGFIKWLFRTRQHWGLMRRKKVTST